MGILFLEFWLQTHLMHALIKLFLNMKIKFKVHDTCNNILGYAMIDMLSVHLWIMNKRKYDALSFEHTDCTENVITFF